MNEVCTDLTVDGRPAAEIWAAHDRWCNRFESQWKRDRTLTAAVFVRQHPELAGDKSLLVKLVSEEFHLRSNAGEVESSLALLNQFPDCQKEIETQIAACKLMGGDCMIVDAYNALLASLGAAPWAPAPPTIDDNAVERTDADRHWPDIGQRLGGFLLLKELGRGGSSRVYLAEECSLGHRQVVVKASPRGGNEAHLLGQLDHPNIVRVYSVQTEPEYGLTLICMPFVSRVTLHHVMLHLFDSAEQYPTRGRQFVKALAELSGQETTLGFDPRLSKATYVDAIVHLGAQLAHALAYTNAKSILHRDLKPSNVLLDATGKPMLLDFNLSYNHAQQATGAGCTPGYSAPEVVKAVERVHTGKLLPGRVPADHRSDLYSLGVILYELLTGVHPFAEPDEAMHDPGSLSEWLALQQVDPCPIRELNPDVGPELARLIECCLAFDVDQRPESAAIVAATLQGFLSRRNRARRWVGRHRMEVGAAAMCACLVTAAGAFAVANMPGYAERQFQAAQQANEQDRWQTSLVHLSNAEDHGFDRRKVAELRGEAHYRLSKQAFEARDFVASRDECNQAIEAGRQSWQIYLLRARSEFHVGEFDLALDDLNRVQKRATTPALHSARADCMCGKKKFDLALLAYKKATEDGFQSAGLLNNMAFSLIRCGHRDDALEYLNQALAIDPMLVDAYCQRARLSMVIALDSGQEVPSAAINDIERALSLAPTHERIHCAAAEIYAGHERVGGASDRKKATESVLQSLRLGFDPAQFSEQGPLAQLVEDLRGTAEFAAAISQGSQHPRSEPLGLVDSLAGIEFD